MKKTYEQLTKINDADIASVVEYPSFVTKIEKEQYRIIQMLIASHRKTNVTFKRTASTDDGLLYGLGTSDQNTNCFYEAAAAE